MRFIVAHFTFKKFISCICLITNIGDYNYGKLISTALEHKKFILHFVLCTNSTIKWEHIGFTGRSIKSFCVLMVVLECKDGDKKK